MISRVFALVAVFATLLSPACVSSGSLRNGVGFSSTDELNSREIIVRISNASDQDVCIAQSAWPDDKGRVERAQNVTLVVGQREFFLREMGHYDCFDFNDEGICSHLVAPGETLLGHIPYTNFGLPEELAAVEKSLICNPPFYLSNNKCRPY